MTIYKVNFPQQWENINFSIIDKQSQLQHLTVQWPNTALCPTKSGS